jgi:phosphoribosylanthranilate isomerase
MGRMVQRSSGDTPGHAEGTRPRVKICGITRLEDGERALSLGAWGIGLVFYPESPRRCPIDVAAEIGLALRRRLEVVGVFVNAPLDEVARTAESTHLSMIQLHGDEGPSYCDEARRRTGLRVIKATRVRDAASVRLLSAYKTDYHMLDAHVPGRPGGTGERFDWQLAAEHRSPVPLILSGGLRPENVQEAVAAARLFAVDTASGVESSPGRKDPDKLERFFEAVGAVPERV